MEIQQMCQHPTNEEEDWECRKQKIKLRRNVIPEIYVDLFCLLVNIYRQCKEIQQNPPQNGSYPTHTPQEFRDYIQQLYYFLLQLYDHLHDVQTSSDKLPIHLLQTGQDLHLFQVHPNKQQIVISSIPPPLPHPIVTIYYDEEQNLTANIRFLRPPLLGKYVILLLVVLLL